MLFGLDAKSASRQIQMFLELVDEHEELVPEREDYRIAAQIRAALHRTGNPIGTADPIIAACALHRNLTLVTSNTRTTPLFKTPDLNGD